MHVKHMCAVSAPYMLVPLEILSTLQGTWGRQVDPLPLPQLLPRPRRRGREAGLAPRGARGAPGAQEQRAALGPPSGPGWGGPGRRGGPGGVTWRAAAAEGDSSARVEAAAAGAPGARTAGGCARDPEPGPAQGRPGEWPARGAAPGGRAPGGRARKAASREGVLRGAQLAQQGWGAPPEPPLRAQRPAGTATSSPRTGATLSVDAPGQPGFEWNRRKRRGLRSGVRASA